nr:hypothetical protein [Paenibacillus xylanexedens]
MKRFDEIPLDVELKGQLRITNVPHVRHDASLEEFDYTVRSSVEAKVALIYEYMLHNNLKEFDYKQYDMLR